MGLFLHCLYSHHSVIAIVMGLCRYMLPMFLMILSTNIFLTMAEQIKDMEEEREENWHSGTNILKRAMVRSLSFGKQTKCLIFHMLHSKFCKNYTDGIVPKDEIVPLSYCKDLMSEIKQCRVM